MRLSRIGIIGAAMMAWGMWPGSAVAASAPRYVAEVLNADLVGGLTLDAGAIIVYGTDATILRSQDGSDWTHTSTPGNADIARAAASRDGRTVIAVGARASLLRSDDSGVTWKAIRSPVDDIDLKAVINVPDTPVWVAAGSGGRLLRSQDNGRSWTVASSGHAGSFLTLTHDATSAQILVGGETGLVGHSRDLGKTWSVTRTHMPEPATPVSGFHRFGGLLVATSARGRLLTSTDDAGTWSLLQADSNAFFTDAAYDPVHSHIVVTGHNGDVLRSADGGASWQGSEALIDGVKAFLGDLHFDERSRSLLALGGGGLLARSEDGGITWSRASRDLRGAPAGLLPLADRRTLLVYGAGGGIASSTDSGAHWTHAREPLASGFRRVTATPDRQALLATGRLGERVRSADGGRSWQVIAHAYPNAHTPPDLRALSVAPSGKALLAAGPPGAILRSSPDGSAWELHVWNELEAERAFTALLIDGGRGLAVAVEARGAMQVSRDDGNTWVRRDAPGFGGEFVYWHGAVRERDGLLLVAGKSGRAARSEDQARTWTGVDTGTDADLFGSHADQATGQFFLMGARGALLRSADGGRTWLAAASGTSEELRRVVRAPRGGALLCFGTHGSLLRSVDDGATWTPVRSGTDGVLREAALEPGTGNLLIVGSRGTLTRSTDGGRTWRLLDTHTARHFEAMVADPSSGTLVLAGERLVRLVRQSPP